MRYKGTAAPPPDWTAKVDPLLQGLVRRVTLLSSATPRNAEAERARLIEAFTQDRPSNPTWQYAPRDVREARRELGILASHLDTLGATPLRDIYLARVTELTEEAALCEAIGKPTLAPLAEARFLPAKNADDARALAEEWIASGAEEGLPVGPWVRSDDDGDPRSLLSQMRAEIGRLRLPFAVVVHPDLSSLAATGERTILVAGNRLLSEETTRRTVMHEVLGHALPRARATSLSPAIFQAGTARGIDEQEGFALCIEQQRKALGPARRRELAGRYLAVCAMREGRSFRETVLTLRKDRGLSPAEAVHVAERCFRGSDGAFAGLGRERIYLETFLRVRDWIEAHPDDETILSSGQVSLDSLATLRPFVPSRRRVTSS